MYTPLAIGMPGTTEWIIIAFIGLLLFGKRLPEVGRSLGKGIIEFKKGLKGVEEDVERQANAPEPQQQSALPNHKFDPYTGKPLEQGQPIAEPRNPA